MAAWGCGTGAAGLAPAVLARPARAAPLAIRVGWATMPGHLIPVLFENPEQKGLRHYGKSYTVQPVLFRGSSPQLMAMASGSSISSPPPPPPWRLA